MLLWMEVCGEGGKLLTMDEEVWREGEKRGHEVVERAALTEKVKKGGRIGERRRGISDSESQFP